MAASSAIYENIKLPEEQFDCFYLEWLVPEKGESLKSYSLRLLEGVNHELPVLIGTSFGGVVVQEMARYIETSRLIIISSIKSNQEFPRRMKLARSTGIYKVLPTRLVEYSKLLLKYNFGVAERKLKLYHSYLSMKDRRYLDWALHNIIHWDRDRPIPGIVHIHGDKDPVFPIKYIQNCVTLKNGTHVMVIHRFRWFNEHLPKLILTGKMIE
ncbi:MAG: alpha/beta hydrolase [Nonlabens sp.]